MIANTAPIDKT